MGYREKRLECNYRSVGIDSHGLPPQRLLNYIGTASPSIIGSSHAPAVQVAGQTMFDWNFVSTVTYYTLRSISAGSLGSGMSKFSLLNCTYPKHPNDV